MIRFSARALIYFRFLKRGRLFKKGGLFLFWETTEAEFRLLYKVIMCTKWHGLQLQLWQAGNTTVKKLKNTMNTQLRLALKLITNLLGMFRWKFPSLYSPFLNPAVRTKCKSRRQENGLIVPRSFLTKTTSQAIATKIEDIIHLKLLRNSDEDHCFCNVALPFICEQLKEDEPQSMSSRTLML